MYEYSEAARRWTRVETFGNIQEPVHDIAFAPNIGTSLHISTRSVQQLCIYISDIKYIDSAITRTLYSEQCTVYSVHDIAFAPNIGTSLHIITKLAALYAPVFV